jgi:hypothetical protein
MAMITASHWAVAGHLGLTRRAARCVEHHFAHPGADRVDRHHVGTRLSVVLVDLSHDEELHPLHQGLLAAGDQSPGDPA